MKIRCLIVDDEPLAIAVIENYIERLPELEIVAKCDNALTALQVLQHQQVDLAFLDIQMPKLTGIDFIKTLRNPPKIVITTAYREYALEGYELNILDYLVKPISFERFLKALNKYYELAGNQTFAPPTETPHNEEEKAIYVKENKKMIKILLKEILFIESLKDYVKIHTPTKSVITKQLISYFEETLDKDKFLRIHKSFIVSKDKIEAFTASSVEITGKELPIGRNYKNEVLAKLNFTGDI